MRTDCLVLSSLRRRAEGRAARNHLLCRQPERHAAPAVSGAHAAHARAVGARRQIHRVARKFRHFAPPARSSLSPSPPPAPPVLQYSRPTIGISELANTERARLFFLLTSR